MISTLRRIVGRLAQFVLWRRVGEQPIPVVVVHVAVPAGDRGAARSLHRSRGLLARHGVAHVGADVADLRAALAACRVRRPVRAAIVSSDRLLGGPLTDAGELTRLRPRAEELLAAAVAGLPAGRVVVAVDLPGFDRLVGDTVAGVVASGGSLPRRLRPDPGLYGDLVERLGGVAGVDEVVLVADDGAKARAAAVAGLAGAAIDPAGPGRRSKRPPWTLRGVLAASAANPHLDDSERALVHGAIRSLTAGGAERPPQAVVPCATRRDLAAVAHVSGCGGGGIRQLHLHVGIQKTATTTVQAAMSAAREQLRQAGVVYVDRSDMMRLRDLRAWGAYRSMGTARFEAFAAQLQAMVRRRQRTSEQAGAASDVVFISNETFVGVIERGPFLERPFRPRAERALLEILDVLQPETCHLSMVTRRQDTLVESMYMWQLHGGEAFDFDRFVAGALRHPEALSYVDLAERLEAVPGVDSLRVQPYETIQVGLDGFLNGLLTPMGVSVDFGEVSFPRRANPSFSERAMVLAKAINPHLDSKGDVVKVREFLRTQYPIGEDHPAATLFTEDDRLRLLGTQASDNEQLFRRWMPAYPADAYARLDTVEMLR